MIHEERSVLWGGDSDVVTMVMMTPCSLGHVQGDSRGKVSILVRGKGQVIVRS